MLQAILFDLDGVITDTAEYHFQAWKRLADEVGVKFNRKENDKLRGISRRKSLEIVLNNHKITESEAESMMERKNRYYQTLIARMTPADVLPGVKNVFTLLHQKHICIAIASVSKNAKTVLEYLQVTADIDVIVDGHMVKVSKPAPDVFLLAAKTLHVKPSSCVVVEDAAAGVQAAHAAGMACIGIGQVAKDAEHNLKGIGACTAEEFLHIAQHIQTQFSSQKT